VIEHSQLPDVDSLERTRDSLIDVVRRFVDVFNRGELDRVMAMFAENGLYRTFEDEAWRGRQAIRRALAPQFRGVFGRIAFEELDLFVDPVAAKVALRWRCVHDFTARAESTMDDLRRRGWRALYGSFATWEGMDVLHVDAEGRVSEKHTYAKARLPRAHRGR